MTGGLEALLLGEHAARIHSDGAHRLWHPPEEFQRIALVAHGGSIGVSVSHLLGLEPVPWAHERMSLGWAGIVRIHTQPIAQAASSSSSSRSTCFGRSGMPSPLRAANPWAPRPQHTATPFHPPTL